MSETVIKLEYPVDYKTEGGATVTVVELSLRRMKARDLKIVKLEEVSGNPAAMFPLIAQLAGLPIDAIEELDITDIKKVIGFMEGF